MTAEGGWTLHQVVDRQQGGMVAAAFEHPAGWQAQSQVVWNYQHMNFPLTSAATVHDPNGPDACDFLPAEAFFWLEPGYGLYRPGAFLMGQTCLKPIPALDAMRSWVIPKHRGRAPGLVVRNLLPLSGLPEMLGIDAGSDRIEAVRADLEYDGPAGRVEEAWFGVARWQRVPYHGPMGTMIQTNWGFEHLFCFRSALGGLSDAKRFFRIVTSRRINPAWEQVCARVLAQIQQQFNQMIAAGYSQIQAAGMLSRTISANNDAFLAGLEQQRSAARHASSGAGSSSSPSSDGFSEYLRGVETLEDPQYGTSQQDYNQRYHWTDGFGNYQHSNDPFFNPNIGGTGDWTLMRPPR